jgi:hypothetical protein
MQPLQNPPLCSSAVKSDISQVVEVKIADIQRRREELDEKISHNCAGSTMADGIIGLLGVTEMKGLK